VGTLSWIAAAIATVFIAVDVVISTRTQLFVQTAIDDLAIVGLAVVGAIVVSRRPANVIGWLLLGIGFIGSLAQFLWTYGYYLFYFVPSLAHVGAISVWAATWVWLLPLGVGLPALALRLPNGEATPDARPIEWLAIGGVTVLLVALALMPGQLDLLSRIQNPFGVQGAGSLLTGLRWIGYVAVGTASLVAAATLVGRLRGAHGDELAQLKWIATAGAVLTVALVYGLVRQVLTNQDLYSALLPFLISAVLLPVAIGVAVLKYRLYEIDTIINRALVYGSLTAGLAGLYAVSVALAQILVGVAGQRSEAAILLTAFVGAAAFTPTRGWLQRLVDGRFAVRDPVTGIDALRDQVQLVSEVFDAERIARRLVFDLAAGYQPRFVSLTLDNRGQTLECHAGGDTTAKVALVIPVHSAGREIGSLTLGDRSGGRPYTLRDRQSLQQCADTVADAIVILQAAYATTRQ
jgi:hypothetical protein